VKVSGDDLPYHRILSAVWPSDDSEWTKILTKGETMQELVIKMILALVMKLLTERFIARTIIHALRVVAEWTTNKLDDDMVDDIAEALGQPDLKLKKA
jgi:hypothetical protein